MKEDKINRYFSLMEDISHRMMRRIHQEIGKKDVGVTGGQVVVLKKLYDNGKMTVSEVAEDLVVSLSAVTALVDRLCKSGMVTRRRDGQDRRLVWLELTEKGNEVVKICGEARRKVLKKYITMLADEDLDRLVEINDKMLQILKSEEQGR